MQDSLAGLRVEMQEKWAENGQLRQELVQCRAQLQRTMVSNSCCICAIIIIILLLAVMAVV